MPNLKDISGQRFGRLVALRFSHRTGSLAQWLCQCDCGVQKTAYLGHLRSGHTISCGCLHRERLAHRVKTHGGSGTRTYRIWKGIRTRCLNPHCKDWKDYGGRGIQICARWDDFAVFFADMGECPPEMTIDRIENGKGYEPGNCKWATMKEQSNNRRPKKDTTPVTPSLDRATPQSPPPRPRAPA